MSRDFDVCVIGSGAGGGPVAFALAQAGYSVAVLEKGPWYTRQEYFKDELACCIRNAYTPALKEQSHVVETELDEGGWLRRETAQQTSWNLWNGNVVGGSSNFMSGYFHRLKPVDFRLLSTFGPIEGANIADWPIDYAQLEPYYTKVEHVVGVSGRVVAHPHQEPRSTPDYPYPPTVEHPLAGLIDKACEKLAVHSLPMPRAILSQPHLDRQGCSYSGYCGSYGCATGAKGDSRSALLNQAVAGGRCKIFPDSQVTRLLSGSSGQILAVEYRDSSDVTRHLDASLYVVACQAVETSRLLLNSVGEKHPQGLANNNGQVGRNLLFAGGGAGSGRLHLAAMPDEQAEAMRQVGPFINRTIHDYYVIDDADFGERQKGGVIDFVHLHPNPIARANRQVRGPQGLLWGKPLKRKLEEHFRASSFIKIEAFCDWLPVDDCFVTLDSVASDKWGMPLAKARLGFHVRNLQVGWYLAAKGAEVLRAMDAKNVVSFASGAPPLNLMAGGCRFGNDPKTSVLDADCRAHDVDNLYITDGSFMPNAGSAPFTWTIYANAFRVADRIIERLGGDRTQS